MFNDCAFSRTFSVLLFSSNASWFTTTERDWWREGKSRPCWMGEDMIGREGSVTS